MAADWVTATGTLAMHILIPVLLLAAADFSVARRAIQQAIAFYLFGIAGGQHLPRHAGQRGPGRYVVLSAGGPGTAGPMRTGSTSLVADISLARRRLACELDDNTGLLY